MEFENQLKIINAKYYNKIISTYGHFIKRLASKGNLATDIIPLSLDDCIGIYLDMADKRGRCDTNGKICIRVDKFNEHVLVHEFIHRLSNNRKYLGGIQFGTIQGFNANYKKYLFPHGYCDLTGFNELITEYLTMEITNYKEPSMYQLCSDLVIEAKNRLGNDRFDELIRCYFQSDLRSVWPILYDLYGINFLKTMNRITEVVCRTLS